MSRHEDSHDQNKGLETPDTAPSRIRVIGFALLGYLLVACMGYMFLYGFDVSRDAPAPQPANNSQLNNNFPAAAYFTSESVANLIPQQIQLANLQPAADEVGLATVLGTYPEIRIIFADDTFFNDEVSADLLKQQFDNGKMIVGLRTPHSQLSQLLGQSPELADLSQDEKANSVIWASIWYTDDQGNPAELSRSWSQFPTMMSDLHALAAAGDQ